RRHPRARRGLLCGTGALDGAAGARRLCRGDPVARRRRGVDHGRRTPRRQGHAVPVVIAKNARIQNRSLRPRISAKTCAGGASGSLTAAATAGTSARRNGLTAFSSPIVLGIVGSPAAVSLDT